MSVIKVVTGITVILSVVLAPSNAFGKGKDIALPALPAKAEASVEIQAPAAAKPVAKASKKAKAVVEAPAEAAPVAAAPAVPASAPEAVVPALARPFRTWVAIQSYIMDTNGDPKNPISNVRIDVKFPGDKNFAMPDAGQYWPIGNGQTQEINRVFEVPASVVQNDGFNFVIQMVRKGSKMLPCNFNVTQLSQYNRTYFCHTDVEWQISQKYPEEKLNKEGIQIRVFTDLNTPAKELPKDAIALR